MRIAVQELSKAFGGKDIFNNFSMEVDSGQRLCVCGPNGTGKSTLLRMIAGAEAADAGRILLPKGCQLGYVEQELAEQTLDLPLLDYVLTSVHDWADFWKKWEKAAQSGDKQALEPLMANQAELESKFGYNPELRAREVLTGLSFSPDKWQVPLRQLSGGWRERAKLARVLTAGADALLLDEPTNHLDVDAIEWLENFLLGFEGALIFVAHDRVFMDRIGTHILYMGLSRPIFRKATYTQFLTLQAEYNAQREREAKALQDELARKMAFVDRFRAKATKARQAASHQKMAKKIEKELEDYKPEAKRKELAFSWPKAPHSEKVTIAAADLDFQFADGFRMWPPLNFTLYRGQRIGLVGHNGCGKSTLIKILAGRLQKTGGNLAIAPQIRMGYYTQHQMETFQGNATVLAEIRRLADPRTTEEELMSVLGLFLLGQSYFDRPVGSLSGGEKSRLALAVLFLKKSNFLLLDEPTNHLDLESRESLAKALQNYDGTLLMVAHDRWLLGQTAAEAWELNGNGLYVHESFAAYETSRKLASMAETQVAASNAGATSRERLKQQKRVEAEKRNALHRKLKPLQEKYDMLEKSLEADMSRQTVVEEQLADPQIYEDGKRASALLKEYEELRKRTEKMLEEMERLEHSISEISAQ